MSLLGLRPSSAKRWCHCKASPGFLLQNAHRVSDDSSRYADEGTVAHGHCETALVFGLDMAFCKDKDMLKHVKGYHDFVMSHSFPGAKLVVERKVELFYFPPDGHKGTVDAAWLHPERIIIDDLKYGAGVNVEAEDNEQLAIYARSLIEEFRDQYPEWHDRTPISLNIYQPRIKGHAPFKTWNIGLGELIAFTDALGDVAEDIIADPFNQPFESNPDGWCRFCKAQAFCRAYAEALLGEMQSEPVGLTLVTEPVTIATLPAPATLPPSVLADIYAKAPDLIKWLGTVTKFVTASVMDETTRKDFPAYKVVRGGGAHRKWKNAEEAEQALSLLLPEEDYLSQPELISPAQAEDKLKDIDPSFVEQFAYKPEGALKVVPVTDKRPAHQEKILDAFDIVDVEAETLS